jgi:hypothetical protein
MAGGQHQLIGDASLELCRRRKIEYLNIPLKDSIMGWRLEWFIVENHYESLPPPVGEAARCSYSKLGRIFDPFGDNGGKSIACRGLLVERQRSDC